MSLKCNILGREFLLKYSWFTGTHELTLIKINFSKGSLRKVLDSSNWVGVKQRLKVHVYIKIEWALETNIST